MSVTSEDLLDRISSAFGDALRPGRVSRSVAMAIDNEWAVPESRRTKSHRKELPAQDDDNHWWELTDKDIEAYGGIFPYLDAEAFRFYLPAFMSYALRRHRTSSSSATDWAISACAYSRERFALFDGAQLHCVLDFLIFFSANGDRFTSRRADEALDFLTGPSS
jgi:hypothetical protein